MTSGELTTKLTAELKGLNTQFTSDDYVNAISDAEDECGWSLPVTDSFQVLWIKNRAKRHMMFYLMTEKAGKFKVDQINLNQPFDHLSKTIKVMDEQFEAVQKSRPEKFASADAYKMFGTIAGPGFKYDSTGNDITDYTYNPPDYGS